MLSTPVSKRNESHVHDSPIVPTLTRCRIDIRYHAGEILVTSTGLSKELRWAAQLHGGERRGKAWAIPVTKLHGFIEFCSSRGSEVVPEGFHEYLITMAHVYDLRYSDMRTLPKWGDMYPFQQSGAQFLATYPRALLLDEMGLGKTITALMALPSGASGIIVCPASLRLNWKVEGEKWRPDLEFVVRDRPAPLNEMMGDAMVIMSPEGLVRSLAMMRASDDEVPAVIKCSVFDEAHYFKNKDAKRSEAAAWVAKHAQICWGLSGTIMTNTPPDVRGVLRTFGLFNAAFATGYYFDNQFGMERDSRTGEVTWPEDPPHAEEVARSIGRVAMRRTRAEVLPDLPEKTWATVTVDISGVKGVDGQKIDIPDVGDAIERVYTAENKRGTKAVPADWTVIGRTRALVAEAKIPAMLEFVARFVESGTPLVVACYNRAPLDALKEAGYPTITGSTSHLQRSLSVMRFQCEEVGVIGIQLQAGGTGITLTRASHMLMVQRDWSPAVNVQAEDRICRIGQEHPVIIYDMFANHPLDQKLSRALRAKQTRIASTIGKVGDSVLYGAGMVAQLRALAEVVDKRVAARHTLRTPHAVSK